MAIVSVLVSVVVKLAILASCVIAAYAYQVASMAIAINHLNAFAMPDGMVYFALNVSGNGNI